MHNTGNKQQCPADFRHLITGCGIVSLIVMLDMILLGVAAVLVVTLFEIIEERKRKAFIINRMFEELNSAETITQNMVSNYER